VVEIFLLFLIMVILMIIGVPVFLSMGLTTVAAFFVWGQGDFLLTAPMKMFEGTNSYALLAVPFFILAGNLMNTGGITRRIFRFANNLVGWLPGGLGHVNVMASVIFSGMSGSAVADAVGLGQMEMQAMEDAGFDRPFSAAITAASSTIGPVIPPSIPFVLFASLTGVETLRLFMAGFAPGILMAIAMMVAVFIIALVRKYPRGKWPGAKEFFRSFAGALLPCTAPAILIGGILGGIFTPTEAAVVCSLYALILGFAYRELKLKHLPKIFWETIKNSASLMFIMAAAQFFAYFLNLNNVADNLVGTLTSIGANKSLLIGFIMIIILILGFFIEGNAIFVLTIPLFFPIVQKFGINPVQFGVFMTLGIMIGNLTPPVGMCLFAVSRISKATVGEITREVWPFLLGIAVVWVLIAFIPEISTFLPNLVMGPEKVLP
jgi:C4-dicarboxylate transporter DctM subunit